MNEIQKYEMSEMSKMARAVTESGLFGIKNEAQALALMLIAHAEGRHPVLAARDYDIIETEVKGQKQIRPAKKAEAMLRDFLQCGGSVEWHELSDTRAKATFRHPSGGQIIIEWDINRAQNANLAGKPMWQKYPRALLRSRVLSEGIRTVCPMATSGMYVPEEVRDGPEVTIDAEFQRAVPEVKLPQTVLEESQPLPPCTDEYITRYIGGWRERIAAGRTTVDHVLEQIGKKYTISEDQLELLKYTLTADITGDENA